MKLRSWFQCGVPAVLLWVSLNGCLPSDPGQSEEEKEAHYIAGRSCINSMDYKGAIEEFEKAVEVNPRSASSHFQLGTLYEEGERDPAAAIYHYEQYLKLRPKCDNAEFIRLRITNCMQDLAKNVLPLPLTPGMQRQFQQLADQNRQLRDENEKWKAYFASLPPLPPPSDGQTQSARSEPQSSAPPQPVHASAPNPGPSSHPSPASSRSHTVQSGDTAYSIAKKYGVKLDALLAANPGIDPRRLRIGQAVNIP